MTRRPWWEQLLLLPRLLFWLPLLLAFTLVSSILFVLAERVSQRARVDVESPPDGAYDEARDVVEDTTVKIFGHILALFGGGAFGALIQVGSGLLGGGITWQHVLSGSIAAGLAAVVGYLVPSPAQQAGK